MTQRRLASARAAPFCGGTRRGRYTSMPAAESAQLEAVALGAVDALRPAVEAHAARVAALAAAQRALGAALAADAPDGTHAFITRAGGRAAPQRTFGIYSPVPSDAWPATDLRVARDGPALRARQRWWPGRTPRRRRCSRACPSTRRGRSAWRRGWRRWTRRWSGSRRARRGCWWPAQPRTRRLNLNRRLRTCARLPKAPSLQDSG